MKNNIVSISDRISSTCEVSEFQLLKSVPDKPRVFFLS